MGNFFGGKKKNKATATTASSDAGQAAADTKKPKKGTSKPESDAAPAVERSDATGENGSVKRTSKKHATTDPPATDSPKKTRKPKGKVAAESDSASAEPKPKSKKSERAKSNEDDGGDFGDELVNAQKKKATKEDFDLMAVIGRGSFGKVMQVRHKETGKIYAMKVMRKDAIIAKNQVAHTRDEKNILQRIRHPFIVNLNYAFQTKDKLYMILDYVNGGELFYHLKKEGKFSEERVQLYAAEIASALVHLHSFGIIYRDLKPENILLDRDGHIVITDFGLSKEVPKDDSTHTFCGTPEYLAPEVLRGVGHSYPVDWWSLGTLVYEMLTGLPPFYSKHINVMYQKILNAQLTFPQSMSDDARSLLEGLLTRDPAKRLGGEAIRKHPFFKGLDWEKLEARDIEAPWKPPVKNDTDITQIDEYFTQERPSDSPVEGALMDELDDDDKDMFEGFTFAGKAGVLEESD